MAEISFNINDNGSTITTNRPILKEGFASCIRCGNTGVKDTFYGRGKQFCSSNCVKQGTKSISNQQTISSANLIFPTKRSINLNNTAPSFSHQLINKQQNFNNNHNQLNQSINNQSSNQPNISSNNHLNINKQINSTSNQQSQIESTSKLDQQHLYSSNQSDNLNKLEMKTKTNKLNGKLNSSIGFESQTKSKQCSNSFDWLQLLNKDPTVKAAPVSSFKHVPIADLWNQLVSYELKVEVKNRDPYIPPDCKSTSINDYYWIASLIRTEGYFLLLRFEGYEDDSSADFWINIYSSFIHPVGWSAANHKSLVPPRQIVHKQKDWKDYLYNELKKGCKTLPDRFADQIKESLKSNFRLGMKLEVIDKRRVSSVRLATINKIIGNRLHVIYDGLEDKDNGFWCHQQSSLIHPIGWAMLVGHELRATSEYAINSLEKVKSQKWAENDADFSYFPHLGKQMIKDASKRKESVLKFKKGQKLEAIDPLVLSTICCATVTKVLRYNYIMVGIDGMMQSDGSDWFCYHTSSGNIFPLGSCAANKITLTPPRDYPKPFNWFNYLKENKAEPVPVSLFNNELPEHGFEEGMYLEAVDLMEPRLICVAQIVKVVGRLLKIHFNGWDESYDQWCDCESVEIYPLGWCSIAGYPLEPPKSEDNGEASSGISMQNSFVFDNTIKKRNKQAYKGGRSKKRKRNTLSISDNLNGSRDDEDQIINNSNYSNDDQDNCSLFNLTTESNDFNEQQNQLNNYKEEFKPTNITTNSTVIFKSSPLSINNNSSSNQINPNEWKTEDVINYFQTNDCGNDYLKSFKEHNISGDKLFSLKREDVFSLFDNKLGPSLKALQLIEELKDKYLQ